MIVNYEDGWVCTDCGCKVHGEWTTQHEFYHQYLGQIQQNADRAAAWMTPLAQAQAQQSSIEHLDGGAP